MGELSRTNPGREEMRRSGTMLRWVVYACTAVSIAVGLGGGMDCVGQATALPLVLPSAIVFDAQGNLYFAETGNHVVRRFSTVGAVTIVAGDGVQGFAGDGGPATAAELDSPSGLAMDGAGNLFIGDTHNHRVREVSAGGMITTVAGTGIAGFAGDGGAAMAARLDRPTALAMDGAGNLYVADTDNHRVRKIAAGTGVITTVAGNGVEGFAGDGGAAVVAEIDSPNGLAVDGAGDLFVADTHNGRVREVSAATGLIATVAGVGGTKGNVQGFGGDGGAATAAGLALPKGLTLDAAGNLYVADSANHRVRRVSSGGVISTVAGQGTETFAGDGAPAVAASLNSPRSVAVSPAGLVTLADSGNQRLRQVDALGAPGPDIHTLAGLGETEAGSLLLSGPSVAAYGSGVLTASVGSGGGYATGSVTFLELSTGATTQLGLGALVGGSASYAMSGLAAGAHTIVATYAGDAMHGAAQSSALAVMVTPLGLVVGVTPASMLYGQAAPVLSGAVSGVLAQDVGKVSAGFSVAAGALSPVGAYPIAATLTGSAAGNYALTTTPANFTIAQAPTLTTLTASTSAPELGVPVTFSVQAASTTSGVPTGSVTVLDGGSLVGTGQIAAGGATSVSVSALAAGAHSVTAVYLGDGNFLASTSAAAVVTVGGAATSDFSLSATGAATQTVAAGSAAIFNFSVGMQGTAIASPITLAVAGAPLGATVSLNPAYVPPGGGVTSFTLTVQTPMAELRGSPLQRRPGDLAALAFLLLPGIGLMRFIAGGRWRRAAGVLGMGVACVVLAMLAGGCGNRVNTALEAVSGKSYTLTVTGTATSAGGAKLQHSANVTLTVL
jgi:sugar lactone lactonase YvrE